MRDIVATIAAEQDVIIRAPLAELLVVQGGPGTGKTAVGLHRAAFLLFEHRLTLMEKQVLVVGPNPLFLRYIAEDPRCDVDLPLGMFFTTVLHQLARLLFRRGAAVVDGNKER